MGREGDGGVWEREEGGRIGLKEIVCSSIFQVRSADAVWHDTRKQLKQDHRWGLAELLESSDRERLFQEHIEGLMEKKRLQFRRLLEETSQVGRTLSTPPSWPSLSAPPPSLAYSTSPPSTPCLLWLYSPHRTSLLPARYLSLCRGRRLVNSSKMIRGTRTTEIQTT